MEDSAFCRPLGQPLYRSNHHRPFPTPPGGRLLLDPRCWWCPLPAVLGLGNCRQLHMKFTLDLFRIHQGYFFSKRQCYRRWWDTIVFTFAYDGHILRMVAVTFSISPVTTELKAALGACAIHVIEENRPRSAPEKRASLCCRISPIEYIMATKSFKMVKLLGWLVSPEAIDEINIEKC